MTEKERPEPADTTERAGPTRDFASFAELEFERLRNSDKDFDAQVFAEAVALVLGKIAGLHGGEQEESANDHQ
jgi:hypothetical protein